MEILLCVIAFVGYMWITRKKRRNQRIEKLIQQSLHTGRPVVSTSIFWVSFCSYALENGGGNSLTSWERERWYEQTSWTIIKDVIVNGTVYVMIIRFYQNPIRTHEVTVDANVYDKQEYTEAFERRFMGTR